MSRFSVFYANYMLSSQWKARCFDVLQRDKYLCQACFKHKATQVHHLTYKRVGKERLEDLISVCKRCHNIITRCNRKSRLKYKHL
jgi:5-methylcytosine-specific restriction endonuclease McrA